MDVSYSTLKRSLSAVQDILTCAYGEGGADMTERADYFHFLTNRLHVQFPFTVKSNLVFALCHCSQLFTDRLSSEKLQKFTFSNTLHFQQHFEQIKPHFCMGYFNTLRTG